MKLSDAQWFHFGDLDPDGFLILEHLRRATGIDFLPKWMDEETLLKFRPYWKKLTKGDRTKLNNLLLGSGRYLDVLERMLKEDAKLEQEVVALKKR